jgi:hypothetical protein
MALTNGEMATWLDNFKRRSHFLPSDSRVLEEIVERLKEHDKADNTADAWQPRMTLMGYANWLRAFLRNGSATKVHVVDRNMLESVAAALSRAYHRINELKTTIHAMNYGAVIQMKPPIGSKFETLWRKADEHLVRMAQKRLEEAVMPKEFDRSKPKFRIFREGTVKGECDPCPKANFYDTFEEAEQRAVEILNSVNEPLHIFRTVAIVSPKPQYVTSVIEPSVVRHVTRRKKR